LRQRGWPVELVPDEGNAAALVAAFAARGPEATAARILYPASSRALPTIAAGLRQLGAEVTQVEAYRTGSAPLDVAACRDWIAREGVAAVTFASPSAVSELAEALGHTDFDRLLHAATAVAIGRTTARALSARGHHAVIADAATLEGLAVTTLRLLETRS
jgi:uroporphyrinogen-III synthase